MEVSKRTRMSADSKMGRSVPSLGILALGAMAVCTWSPRGAAAQATDAPRYPASSATVGAPPQPGVSGPAATDAPPTSSPSAPVAGPAPVAQP